MSNNSKIEWTDATWNPVRGCSIVSKGCTNCYAMKQAHRFSGKGQAYEGLTKLTNGGPVWTGKVRLVPELLDRPLTWKKPRRVFVNSMSDLFHEDVPFEFIECVFGVMGRAPQHIFQILTKRPRRMMKFMSHSLRENWCYIAPTQDYKIGKYSDAEQWPGWPLPNVWLGVSVEDQTTADERIPLLLQTSAAVRWLSMEPLLGDVDLTSIDWVVAGGESGPGARPTHPDWFRSLRDQCQSAGTPFFFKQWGDWKGLNSTDQVTFEAAQKRGARDVFWWKDGAISELVGKKNAGRILDGRTWDEYPS